jgi:hypothetical protein
MGFTPQTATDMGADMQKDYEPIQDWNGRSSPLCLAVAFEPIAANVVANVGQ